MVYAKISNQETGTGGTETADILCAGRMFCFYLADEYVQGKKDCGSSVDTAERVLCESRHPEVYVQQAFDIVQGEWNQTENQLNLLILELYNGTAYIGHSGNVRLYCFQDGKIVFRSEEERQERYRLDGERPLKNGQAFLMCTEGFWEGISEKKMEDTLKSSGNVQEWLERLERIIKRRDRKKGQMHYSAIGIWN